MRWPLLFVACGCSTNSVLDLLPLVDGSNEVGPVVDTGTSDGGARDADCTDAGCPCGLTACDGGCFDLGNDPIHCGGCDQGCAHNGYCQQSHCTCLGGLTNCNNMGCPDLLSDPEHCGACAAIPCNLGDKCELGACGTGACTNGRTPCDVGGKTACVDLTKNLPYCGACGVTCAPNEICTQGKCAVYVPATPCTQCPCDGRCAATVGTTTCCPGINGGTTPICVHAAACP